MSAVLQELAATPNPEYRVTHVENVCPFKVAAEADGRAVRCYLRERNTITAVVFSAFIAQQLVDALTAAIEEAGR